MLGPAAREMLDLLPARNARGHDLRLLRGRLDRRREPTVPERHRDVVVLALEAERAGHAAAARIDLLDLEPGPAECRYRGRRADERLLMAVAVEQRLLALGAEREREPAGALADQELFEQERVLRDGASVVAAHQIHGLVAQGQKTRRLEADDRDAAARVWRQTLDVPDRV